MLQSKKSKPAASFSEEMEEIQKLFDSTEPASFEKIPAGMYECEIIKAVLGKSKQNKRTQVVWTFRIDEDDSPEYNRTISKFSMLDNEDGIGYFKADLARLGAEAVSFNDLGNILEELVGSRCQISVKEDKDSDFLRVYIQSALDGNYDTKRVEPNKAGPEPAKKGKGLSKFKADEGTEEPVPTKKTEEPKVLLINFESEALLKKHKDFIVEVAEASGFELSDYESHLVLLNDLCEKLKITGEYDSPNELIVKIKENS